MELPLLAILSVLLAISSQVQSDNWALLVAGSNSWWNYRHQADICHAYQILKNRGFPEDRIVTMMYDDIANNEENPRKGEIINEPNGKDVYAGVKIDYKGEDVTPANFLKVLKGDKAGLNGVGTGRVIESGSEDTVFVNFADHGGPGILCFPNDNLYADDLEKTLRDMANAKQFNKLVVYVEACEAGSMFDHILEENNNIYVSTASAADESSYGCYCDDSTIDTCLGDLYSVVWMQHMDQNPAPSETLFHQYQYVRTWTNQSHVNLYGDYRLGFDKISDYLGGGSQVSNNVATQKSTVSLNPVSSRDVPVYVLKKKIDKASSLEEKYQHQKKLSDLLQKRKLADKTIKHILGLIAQGDHAKYTQLATQRTQISQETFSCYKQIIQQFNQICFNTSDNNYVVKHFYKFVNVCNAPWASADLAVKAMRSICNEVHQSLTETV